MNLSLRTLRTLSPVEKPTTSQEGGGLMSIDSWNVVHCAGSRLATALSCPLLTLKDRQELRQKAAHRARHHNLMVNMVGRFSILVRPQHVDPPTTFAGSPVTPTTNKRLKTVLLQKALAPDIPLDRKRSGESETCKKHLNRCTEVSHGRRAKSENSTQSFPPRETRVKP